MFGNAVKSNWIQLRLKFDPSTLINQNQTLPGDNGLVVEESKRSPYSNDATISFGWSFWPKVLPDGNLWV